jgi:hypothetical protein
MGDVKPRPIRRDGAGIGGMGALGENLEANVLDETVHVGKEELVVI